MRPQRKITRLGGYDYRQSGAYFITICVQRCLWRRNVWSEILNGKAQLNRYGLIVEEAWNDLPQHHDVEIDEYVIMPNHFHGIVFLFGAQTNETQERSFGALPSASLSVVVGSFKSAVSRCVGQMRGCPTKVWQPRFYERIIRDENELNQTRRYIAENPANWPDDKHHPANQP